MGVYRTETVKCVMFMLCITLFLVGLGVRDAFPCIVVTVGQKMLFHCGPLCKVNIIIVVSRLVIDIVLILLLQDFAAKFGQSSDLVFHGVNLLGNIADFVL